jgi:hypothetical protein
MKLYRPMTPGGGAFLTCVGAALLAAAALSWPIGGYVLLAGFAAGAVALTVTSVVGRRRGLPKPSLRDLLLVWGPALAELLVFFFLFPLLPHDERLQTTAVIAVVGLHFLPMIWSFGPLILWLGLACIGVAAAGLFVPQIPLTTLIAADGFLKLTFGLLMFAALFRVPGRTPAAVR